LNHCFHPLGDELAGTKPGGQREKIRKEERDEKRVYDA
jgi:hypothetical protein